MAQKYPNFFVVGVAKAGTTALHYLLQQHPDVYLPPIKECHYFSVDDMQEDLFRSDYYHAVKIDMEKYLAKRPLQDVHSAHVKKKDHYLALFDDAQNQKAQGEICNSYFFAEGAAERIKRFNPDAKIILMLRNPIERAFSGYIMNLREGKTKTQDFLKEIENDRTKTPKGWGISINYIEMGLYAEQLKRYLDAFDRHQIKIVLFDDLKRQPNTLLKALFKFLGIDENATIDSSTRKNEAALPRFKRFSYFIAQHGYLRRFLRDIMPSFLKKSAQKMMFEKANLPKISDAERAALIPYFKDDILALEQLTKLDLSNWYKLD